MRYLNLRVLLKRIWVFLQAVATAVEFLYILSMVVSATALGAAIYAFLVRQWLLVCLGAANALFGIALLLAIKFWIELKKPRQDFQMEEVIATYEYLPEPRQFRFHKYCRVKALYGGIDRFQDRVVWTGSGSGLGNIMARPAGHRVVGFRREGQWRVFDVFFGTHLARGQTHEFELEWPRLCDKEGTAQPYLAKVIREPTVLLKQCVILPHEAIPTEIKYEVLPYESSPYPIETYQGRFNRAQRQIIWEVKNPIFSQCYRIRWEWEREPWAGAQQEEHKT